MSKGSSSSPASVRQRLLNLSRDRGEDFQLVLMRYAIERLLYRLAQSPYAGDFVLKGAMLFGLWADLPHRSTLDLDLAGLGDDDVDRVLGVFREVCEPAVEQDGLVFDTSRMYWRSPQTDRYPRSSWGFPGIPSSRQAGARRSVAP